MEAEHERAEMIARQLEARGIGDARVLEAMHAMPREAFVPSTEREDAYRDGPLSIGHGQTISQPYIVARMLELLELQGHERVLEVGAGSGYAAALLARLAREVWALERIAELADAAKERLERLNMDNVHVLRADGTDGLPTHAPYDAILVSAGGPVVPAPLLEQLSLGGRMVIPVGDQEQVLVRYRRTTGGLIEERFEAVRFVPLIRG